MSDTSLKLLTFDQSGLTTSTVAELKHNDAGDTVLKLYDDVIKEHHIIVEGKDDILPSARNRYYDVALEKDPEGSWLCRAARELTGINVSDAFPYEENKGLFELSSYFTELKYILAKRFNAIRWDIVPGTIYEAATLLPITKSEEYQEFTEQMYEKALELMTEAPKTVFRMYANVKFNVPMTPDVLLTFGPFEFLINGQAYELDFEEISAGINKEDPHILNVECRNPDFDDFPKAKQLTPDMLSNVSKIAEFSVGIGDDFDADQDIESIEPVEITEAAFVLPYENWKEIPIKREVLENAMF